MSKDDEKVANHSINTGAAKHRNSSQRHFGFDRVSRQIKGPAPPLDDELIEKVFNLIRAGNFRYIAAAACGVNIGTWQKWIRVGSAQIREHAESGSDLHKEAHLVRAIEKAEADTHNDIIQDVLLGDNMQAKLWYLERRYNKLYNKNPNSRIDDESGETIKLDAASIIAERLRQFIEKG